MSLKGDAVCWMIDTVARECWVATGIYCGLPISDHSFKVVNLLENKCLWKLQKKQKINKQIITVVWRLFLLFPFATQQHE